MEKIDRFFGKYRFLSNFWPCQILMEGIIYPSIENAYQAAKTLDRDLRTQFVDISPGEAKKLGRKLQLRKDWEKYKIPAMELFVFQKFRNPKLKGFLLDTDNKELIEGNTWGDKFWGVCDGVGENHLGKILMKVRDRIRNES